MGNLAPDCREVAFSSEGELNETNSACDNKSLQETISLLLRALRMSSQAEKVQEEVNGLNQNPNLLKKISSFADNKINTIQD